MALHALDLRLFRGLAADQAVLRDACAVVAVFLVASAPAAAPLARASHAAILLGLLVASVVGIFRMAAPAATSSDAAACLACAEPFAELVLFAACSRRLFSASSPELGPMADSPLRIQRHLRQGVAVLLLSLGMVGATLGQTAAAPFLWPSVPVRLLAGVVGVLLVLIHAVDRGERMETDGLAAPSKMRLSTGLVPAVTHPSSLDPPWASPPPSPPPSPTLPGSGEQASFGKFQSTSWDNTAQQHAAQQQAMVQAQPACYAQYGGQPVHHHQAVQSPTHPAMAAVPLYSQAQAGGAGQPRGGRAYECNALGVPACQPCCPAPSGATNWAEMQPLPGQVQTPAQVWVQSMGAQHPNAGYAWAQPAQAAQAPQAQNVLTAGPYCGSVVHPQQPQQQLTQQQLHQLQQQQLHQHHQQQQHAHQHGQPTT